MVNWALDYLNHISTEIDSMTEQVRAQAGATIENDYHVQFNRGVLAALSAVKTEVLKCINEETAPPTPAAEVDGNA